LNENQHKILISCPVSSRAWILKYYLDHIYNIDYDKKLIDIYWIANNIKDNSLEILNKFKNKYENEYNSITIEVVKNIVSFQDERSVKIREKYTYNILSDLRNKILKKCVDLNCDYLFSCDSDILVNKDILNRLTAHNLPIVSSLIYNGYLVNNIEEAYKYPNILNEIGYRVYKHIVNYRTKNPKENIVGTLVQCDFTGACVLMSKDVCSKTQYSWHKQGEDEPWSFSARQNGFKLYCDISTFQYHIMSEKILELYLEGKLD
jgi:hypothetical protein